MGWRWWSAALALSVLAACSTDARAPSGSDDSDAGQDAGGVDVFVPLDEGDPASLWHGADQVGVCDAWLPLFDDAFGSMCFGNAINVADLEPEELEAAWTYSALGQARARFVDGCRTLRADLSSLDAFRAWQRSAGDALHRVLRVDAASWPDVPPMVRELGREQRDGYTRIALDWLVEPGQRIPAWLLVPDDVDQPAPAVLFVHGHGDGGRASAVGDPPFEDDYHHAGAARLAEAGYVVLAPDVRSFGDTGTWAEHQHWAELMNFEGLVAYGVFTADLMRALDVLAARPEVDAERIGVTGISMGGQLTAYLTALDPRVKAAVVQGYLGYQNVSLARRREDPCQYIPMLDQLMDVPDIALISAPVPVAWISGAGDPIYLAAEADTAWLEIEAGYALAGADEAAVFVRHNGGHEWMLDPARAFFDEHL